MSYDLVIKNANIVDGSGSEAQRGNIAVAGGKIVALEKALSGGKREIDACGLTLAPGFIDIHTHFDAQISWDPLLTPRRSSAVRWFSTTTNFKECCPTRCSDTTKMSRTRTAVIPFCCRALVACQ
jgi:N-acyl-D-aspartate/D-glutamate deacylase